LVAPRGSDCGRGSNRVGHCRVSLRLGRLAALFGPLLVLHRCQSAPWLLGPMPMTVAVHWAGEQSDRRARDPCD
jgi:hypothetical protein